MEKLPFPFPTTAPLTVAPQMGPLCSSVRGHSCSTAEGGGKPYGGGGMLAAHQDSRVPLRAPQIEGGTTAYFHRIKSVPIFPKKYVAFAVHS